MRWSQNASARGAGGVPVPLFTGDVGGQSGGGEVAHGAIEKAQYSARASPRGSDWDVIHRRASAQVQRSRGQAKSTTSTIFATLAKSA